MSTSENTNLLHWNYFLALEADIEHLARYIEFSSDNFSAYSIEIAHILIASSSEVDVVAKKLCQVIDPDNNASNIAEYRKIIKPAFPELESTVITVPRYGLDFTPWSSWQQNKTPIWWKNHNNVKHQRYKHFSQANLKNALYSMAGLFVLILYYYRETLKVRRIEPPPNLFTPPPMLASVAPTYGGPMALFFKE